MQNNFKYLMKTKNNNSDDDDDGFGDKYLMTCLQKNNFKNV